MVILLKQNHWVWLEFVISSVDGNGTVKVSMWSGDDIYHHKTYKFNSDRIKIIVPHWQQLLLGAKRKKDFG